MPTTKSQHLFQRAQKTIPGGVNSPVRAFKSIGGNPLFFTHGKGAYIYDADGNSYIDYVGSWGPLILGHAHPLVIEAVQKQAVQGLSFGAPTEIEILLAEKICELLPNIEMVRMVSSGTEATMTAIRLARGYTKRNKIIKFNGCYHGHSDSLLAKTGSGVLTLGLPDSAGVPAEWVQHTLIAEFNDLNQVKELFQQYGDDIAAIIIEPVAGNMNCILPLPEFLPGLRKLCDQYQSLLIFDEVMTGFRVALGGAQAHFNIKPDITTLGKVIGGGMPVAALGGRRQIMEYLAPVGPVYQAGTLSGNPIAMIAGLITLKEISKPGFFQTLSDTTRQLLLGLTELAKTAGIPFTTQHLGGMFGLFFSEEKNITGLNQVKKCQAEQFKKFFHAMLQEGIYFAPSMYEAGFISITHQAKEIETTMQAAQKVFSQL